MNLISENALAILSFFHLGISREHHFGFSVALLSQVQMAAGQYKIN